MTSPDLVTWTTVPSWPGATAGVVTVTGDTYFVATAAAGSNDYAWSTDGVTWTLGSSFTAVRGVAWTGSQFFSTTGSNKRFSTGPAGPWIDSGVIGASIGVRRVLFEAGALVVAGSGNPPLAYSLDGGTTWATYKPPSGTITLSDIAYGAGLFVAVRPDSSGNSVFTSPDGAVWTPRNTGTGSTNLYSIAYGPAGFVAVRYTGGTPAVTVIRSVDGITWTPHTPTGFSTSFPSTSRMTCWGGLYAYVAPGNASIWTSPDGITWTAQTFTGADWRGIGAGPAITPPTTRGFHHVGLVRGARGVG